MHIHIKTVRTQIANTKFFYLGQSFDSFLFFSFSLSILLGCSSVRFLGVEWLTETWWCYLTETPRKAGRRGVSSAELWMTLPATESGSSSHTLTQPGAAGCKQALSCHLHSSTYQQLLNACNIDLDFHLCLGSCGLSFSLAPYLHLLLLSLSLLLFSCYQLVDSFLYL